MVKLIASDLDGTLLQNGARDVNPIVFDQIRCVKVCLFYKKGTFQLKILNMVIKKGKRKLPLHRFFNR